MCRASVSYTHLDIQHLKEKVDCGLDFLTTQMFFDNEVFLRFKENCLIKGINIPIIAGIMPITNANQIKRSVELSGCKDVYKRQKVDKNRTGQMGEYPASYTWRQSVAAFSAFSYWLLLQGLSLIHI